MTDAYLLNIENEIELNGATYGAPEQIAATVYAAEKRAADVDENVVVLMDHQEDPFPIRGRSEEGAAVRPDGGYTWYHAPDATKCYMRSMPRSSGTFSRNHAELQRDWAGHGMDLLSDSYPEDNLRYDPREADIYIRDNPADGDYATQVAGLSLRNTRDVTTGRMCWYEEDPLDGTYPASDTFRKMLEEDGVDPDAFADDLAVVAFDLFTVLEERYDPEMVDATQFLSADDLQEAEGLQGSRGNTPKRCVGKHTASCDITR